MIRPADQPDIAVRHTPLTTPRNDNVSDSPLDGLSRRDLLKTTGRIAATSALLGASVPYVYAGQNSTVNLALVGCGGRGTGAISNALSTTKGPTKLVAAADVFEQRLSQSVANTKEKHGSQVEVPDDQKFIGFDGYRKAMDCLKPGDVVILATPPAFRHVMFKYAIEKGLNVFMEKPVSVDGPSSKKMFALAAEADKKGIKVAVGLMCRHCVARGELYQRIRNDEIGEIITLRCYRAAGPTGSAFVNKKPEGMSELLYQIRNFHGFLWASGGGYSDFLIHNIDECCWMKDAFPVEAKGYGGRHYRGDYVDQNFDTYTTEFTFADGTKMFLEGRTMPGCHNEFASYAHGTKGSAIISTASHSPAKCRIYNSQRIGNRDDQTWAFPPPEPSPYQLEWENFMDAIRQNKPYNEAHRGTEASLVTAMGRMACHTGQSITREDILECEHEFAPQVAELTLDGPAPLQAAPDGTYPVPMPGLKKTREY
jgi:predicted dehydrogenase